MLKGLGLLIFITISKNNWRIQIIKQISKYYVLRVQQIDILDNLYLLHQGLNMAGIATLKSFVQVDMDFKVILS